LFLVLGIAILAYVVSAAFFQLEPEEEAIVLRLGKPLTEKFGPGLHTKIPLVDQVYKAPVNRQHRLEFGYRSEPDVVTKVETSGYGMESLMLTGDLMLIHVRWSVVYKIEDIHAWLFEIKDRESTIRDISMAVMRQIVGDYSLEEVLTAKQLEIATLAQEATQAALREKVPTGVLITEIAINASEVPEKARKAFDDLTRTLARVQGELAEAKAEQDNAIGVARKTKNEMVGVAEKHREQVVENARGEASAFRAKAAEYNRAPEITKQWMYLATMKKVLASLDEKYVIDDNGSVAKHLPLKDFMSVRVGGKR
jgi:membrane protease subunit HflK